MDIFVVKLGIICGFEFVMLKREKTCKLRLLD